MNKIIIALCVLIYGCDLKCDELNRQSEPGIGFAAEYLSKGYKTPKVGSFIAVTNYYHDTRQKYETYHEVIGVSFNRIICTKISNYEFDFERRVIFNIDNIEYELVEKEMLEHVYGEYFSSDINRDVGILGSKQTVYIGPENTKWGQENE